MPVRWEEHVHLPEDLDPQILGEVAQRHDGPITCRDLPAVAQSRPDCAHVKAQLDLLSARQRLARWPDSSARDPDGIRRAR